MKLAALALALFAAGCAGSGGDDRREASQEAETRHVDPVSGKTVSATSAWTTEYEGRRFYFESRHTLDQFTRSPAAFIVPPGVK